MNKKIATICMLFLTLGFICIGGCGKNTTQPPAGGGYRPGSITPNVSVETTTANNLKVTIRNITAEAGSDIDYLGAIESVENMELEKSMVYVDSSQVDRFTPGVYPVYYTFDYLGMTANNQITVTIMPGTTSAPPEETTPQTTTGDSSTSNTDSTSSAVSETVSSPGTEDNAPTGTVSNETTASAGQTTETMNMDIEEQNLPDAVITLSTGKTVTIQCTSSRYIVETYTEESYSTEHGFMYLTSELKILLNTGEIQVIETVVTRVASIPEN